MLLIVANVLFFYFFCLFLLPYEIQEKIFEGPPLLKKKLDPLPWAFGARPRMLPALWSHLDVNFMHEAR